MTYWPILEVLSGNSMQKLNVRYTSKIDIPSAFHTCARKRQQSVLAHSSYKMVGADSNIDGECINGVDEAERLFSRWKGSVMGRSQ